MAASKFLAAAIAAALAIPGMARAGETTEIRWLDRSDAASACIGDPATPACAVETLLACRIRGAAPLCASVGLDLAVLEAEAKRSRDGGRGPDPFTVLDSQAAAYRIESVRQIGAGKARAAIGIRFHGADGLTWPEGGWRRINFTIRREAGGWRMVRSSWQPMMRLIDPRSAASRCIGDVRTPVCTVETHIACRIRNDAGLCAKAGRVEGRHFRPEGATVVYLVRRIRRWQPPEPAPPGTIFVIVETMEATQWEPGTRPGEEGGSSESGSDPVFVRPGFVAVSYTLERRSGTWRVTGRAERP
jgi:hypothetical protein